VINFCFGSGYFLAIVDYRSVCGGFTAVVDFGCGCGIFLTVADFLFW